MKNHIHKVFKNFNDTPQIPVGWKTFKCQTPGCRNKAEVMMQVANPGSDLRKTKKMIVCDSCRTARVKKFGDAILHEAPPGTKLYRKRSTGYHYGQWCGWIYGVVSAGSSIDGCSKCGLWGRVDSELCSNGLAAYGECGYCGHGEYSLVN